MPVNDPSGRADNPTGSVTVWVNDSTRLLSDFISLEYTGEDSSSVHWSGQHPDVRYPAGCRQPGVPRRVVGDEQRPRGVVKSGLDQLARRRGRRIPSGLAQPVYDVSGFTHDQVPGRRAAMLDDPGGPSGAAPAAQAFAAAGAAAGATSVTFSATFSTYLVKGNRARYRVDWTATTVPYDITAGTAGPIGYRAASPAASPGCGPSTTPH